MIDILDPNSFGAGLNKIIIGTLTQEVIHFLNLNRKPGNIILWKDRLKYIEKHKSDFATDLDFFKHIQQIPNIIQNPDYIGLHPSDNSIQYIKRINRIMLVGVRIRTSGDLNFRSCYPISEQTLQSYLKSSTVREFGQIDNFE